MDRKTYHIDFEKQKGEIQRLAQVTVILLGDLVSAEGGEPPNPAMSACALVGAMQLLMDECGMDEVANNVIQICNAMAKNKVMDPVLEMMHDG